MDAELIYVYCISDSPPKTEGISTNETLRCLAFGGLYAIVKEVSPDEFSEENLKKNFADLAWIETHARDHIRVIVEVMKTTTVIPFKFGTIFISDERLGNFIDDYALSLNENLQHLKGKEEWSVKIYCDKTKLNSQIGEISQQVHDLELEIQKSMPGKAFILKRKKADLVEKEVQVAICNYGQTCYDQLYALSATTRVNNLLPKEVTERTDDMILNASFFVLAEKVSEFLAIIDQSQEKYKEVGFDIESAGPWPPFSFISLKEK
ncbi:MAG: GvpL/GvpF family gas vesicle protein [Mariniphaga sp.]